MNEDTQTLRDAVQQLAQARREAILLELSQLERLLGTQPTTSELRRDWRSQRRGEGGQDTAVRLREGVG